MCVCVCGRGFYNKTNLDLEVKGLNKQSGRLLLFELFLVCLHSTLCAYNLFNPPLMEALEKIKFVRSREDFVYSERI